jgi:hypothetical protein
MPDKAIFIENQKPEFFAIIHPDGGNGKNALIPVKIHNLLQGKDQIPESGFHSQFVGSVGQVLGIQIQGAAQKSPMAKAANKSLFHNHTSG